MIVYTVNWTLFSNFNTCSKRLCEGIDPNLSNNDSCDSTFNFGYLPWNIYLCTIGIIFHTYCTGAHVMNLTTSTTFRKKVICTVVYHVLPVEGGKDLLVDNLLAALVQIVTHHLLQGQEPDNQWRLLIHYRGSVTRFSTSIFFHQSNPSGPLINRLNWFFLKIRFGEDIRY